MKRSVESAYHESLRARAVAIEPEHLLLGITADPDSGAVRVLTGLGVDVPELRRRLITTPDRPPPLDVPDHVGAPPRLPGRRALLGWHAGLVLAYAVLRVPLVLAAHGAAAVLVAVVAVPVASSALIALLHPVRIRTARRQAQGTGPAVRLPARQLAEALATCGVTDLEVYLHSGRLVRNRGFGLGRHGIIGLSPVTARARDAARFVAAHEAGHVARRDAIRLTSGLFLAEGLVLGGVVSVRLAVAVPAALAALLLAIGTRWAGEFGSDAIAVRWVGPAAAAAFDAHAAALAATGRRGWARRLIAWLHHPPMAVRRRAWRRPAV